MKNRKYYVAMKSANCQNRAEKSAFRSDKRLCQSNRASRDKSANRKQRTDYLRYVCWIIVPIITFVLILLDGLGIYHFNKDRLIVLGIGLAVILLSFFNEITLKDFSVKRTKTKRDQEDDSD